MAQEVKKVEGEQIAPTQAKPLDKIRAVISEQKSNFEKILPAHISFEKFQRTVMTAVFSNPDLLQCDRQSILLSATKCATDGLLPDGREAAFVIFNQKIKGEDGRDQFVKRAQYIPMYGGILKKMRQSGELSNIVTHVVYQKDKFEYVLGDEERVVHEPYMGNEERGEVIAAYAIAKLKDGSVIREVMTRQDIDKVRRSSKAGAMSENDVKNAKKYNNNPDAKIGDPKGIWLAWFEEMARKTVLRRISKWLPQSAELFDRVFEGDDSMTTVSDHAPDAPVMIEADGDIEGETVDSETGEISSDDEARDETPADTGQPDLKAEVEKKKAEKKPAAKKDEKKSDPAPETKPEPEKAAEAFDAEAAEQAVLKAFADAKTVDELNEAWNTTQVSQIDAIKVNDFDGYKRVNAAFLARLKELEPAK